MRSWAVPERPRREDPPVQAFVILVIVSLHYTDGMEAFGIADVTQASTFLPDGIKRAGRQF